MTSLRRPLGRVLLTLSLFAALSACSSSSKGGGATPAATTAAATSVAPTAPGSFATNFPVTVTAANGQVTIKARPLAIVSLSPTATEMVFAIGAGKQVVAVDDQSTYPADAPKTDLSGFKPNVEAIVAKTPDLVLVSDDSTKLSESLGKLGIPVLVLPPAASFDDIYSQIATVGTAVGKGPEAKGVADQIRSTIDEIVKGAPKKNVKVFHEVSTDLYSASSNSFIGKVYALFGVTNIADAADADKGGYPQMSSEAIVAADPQVIFLGDTKYGEQTPATVSARAGWSGIDAVKNQRIINLDDDVAARWSPRIVELVAAVAAALAKA